MQKENAITNPSPEVLRLLDGGQFGSSELERAAWEDSKLFIARFFSDFMNDKIQQWCDECKCRDVLESIYSSSFMFGVCGVFKTMVDGERITIEEQALRYRDLLMGQIIAPDKSLKSWIDKTRSIGLFRNLYMEAYKYGALYMMDYIGLFEFTRA